MKKLRIWETALLISLSVTLLAGAWAAAAEGRLASSLVRLHVIAADNSAPEQAIKLEVRDSVLEYLEPKLESAASAAGAREIIASELEGIASAAERSARGRAVTVTLGEEYYPTREYESFSLPAGRYQSLRVTLGEGEGRNWWCVVFPPLCLAAAEEESAFESLDDGSREIITEAARGVTFKFRLLELWGELLALLGSHD